MLLVEFILLLPSRRGRHLFCNGSLGVSEELQKTLMFCLAASAHVGTCFAKSSWVAAMAVSLRNESSAELRLNSPNKSWTAAAVEVGAVTCGTCAMYFPCGSPAIAVTWFVSGLDCGTLECALGGNVHSFGSSDRDLADPCGPSL